MSSKIDHADLLGRYIRHVRRINRGSDLLSDGHMAPFARDEIAELRRLGGGGPSNPAASYPERTGGTTPGDRPWFTESLKGL